MTQLPRTITSDELTALRSLLQSSQLYLTVHNPTTVYSARLAAVPSSTDQVTSITYNSGSGTHTDILADQTLWIGTSAGAYDLGMVRIRNLTGIAATSGTFNIAEESEIAWASGAYLTIKDDFTIWARHIRMNGTTPYMDYDVAYTDQNSKCDSIPVMGQHRVAWLLGSTVSLTFDASNSWVLNNTITGYSWTAPGASATSGMATSTPTITYNAAGVYRVACTVTNSDAKSFTGYRFVFVVSANSTAPNIITDLRLDSLNGDYDSGGWSAGITLYANADVSYIRDRALCILHTRDNYDASTTSLGFNAGSENVLMIGWIAGESITRGPDYAYGTVSFQIEGPQYWLNRIPAFPVGLKDRTTAPTKWTRFFGLSAKATIWHMLHWRTTITRCCDTFNTPNGYRSARIEAPGAQSLFEQLKVIEQATILASPCADRYGRLHNQIEQQLLGTSDRAAVPNCMTLAGYDISGNVEIERNEVSKASIVDLSGVAYDGTTASPFFSLSPGRVFRHYGDSPDVVERLILYDQSTTNTLCGLYAGWRNNEYPRVNMTLAQNNRFVDIAPYQYYTYTLAASDSPRGVSETLRLIPRSIRLEFNNEAGYFTESVEFEAESFAELAITGDTPQEIPNDPPPPPPPPPPPIIFPPVYGNAREVWIGTASYIYYSGDYFAGGQPTWSQITPGLGTISNFFITADGSTAYLHINNTAWYKGTSLKTSPTWTSILSDASNISRNGVCDGTNFYTVQHSGGDWQHGTYNGSSWSWGTVYSAAWFSPDCIGKDFSIYYDLVKSTSGSTIETAAADYRDGSTGQGAGWVNTTPTRYAWGVANANGHAVLRTPGGSNLVDAGTAANTHSCRVRGAIGGAHIYAVDQNGILHLSDDGASFSSVATWLSGLVFDTMHNGGGSLVWVPNTITASNVPSRIYTRNGSGITDMTGNFWSLTSGDQDVVGAGLVYS